MSFYAIGFCWPTLSIKDPQGAVMLKPYGKSGGLQPAVACPMLPLFWILIPCKHPRGFNAAMID
jgi:hypothetical protein